MYYHYCNVETFKSIMNSKVLWLTDLTDSKDTQEVTRTFDILWSAVKKKLLESDIDRDLILKEIEVLDNQFQLEMVIDKPYGCCFCKAPDVLQQWLEYGDKTRGVVLGFDFNWFEGLEKQMPHPSSKFLHAIGYDEVLYHDKQLEDGFYKICYDAIKEHGLNAWIMGIRPTFKHYSAFIKNPTFFGEYEARIVYYPNRYEEFIDNVLHISGPIENPKTHYCLPWTYGNGNNALKAIGLGCNCELSQEDIQLTLSGAGINEEFMLFKSQCSYRLR